MPPLAAILPALTASAGTALGATAVNELVNKPLQRTEQADINKANSESTMKQNLARLLGTQQTQNAMPSMPKYNGPDYISSLISQGMGGR